MGFFGGNKDKVPAFRATDFDKDVKKRAAASLKGETNITEGGALGKPEQKGELKGFKSMDFTSMKADSGLKFENAKFKVGNAEKGLDARTASIGGRAKELGAEVPAAANANTEGAEAQEALKAEKPSAEGSEGIVRNTALENALDRKGFEKTKAPKNVGEIKTQRTGALDRFKNFMRGMKSATAEAKAQKTPEKVAEATKGAKESSSSIKELGNESLSMSEKLIVVLLNKLVAMRNEKMQKELDKIKEEKGYHEGQRDYHAEQAKALEEREKSIEKKKGLLNSLNGLGAKAA